MIFGNHAVAEAQGEAGTVPLHLSNLGTMEADQLEPEKQKLVRH